MGMNYVIMLRKNVDIALGVLAPKFEVSDEELRIHGKPSVEIGERTSCIYPNRLIFELHNINSELALGEEVSHFLHGVVNPEISKAKNVDEINTRRYVMETVGHYGAIVYLNEMGYDYSLFDVHWPIAPDVNGEDLWNHLAHELGYKRAFRLFQSHGDTLLADLARMDREHANVSLPRLAPLSLYERKFLPMVDHVRVNVLPYVRF